METTILCFRNETWRYKGYPGMGRGALKTVTRGMPIALVAMAITIAADKFLGLGPAKHDEGHH